MKTINNMEKYNGCKNEKDSPNSCIYYGIINDTFDNYYLNQVNDRKNCKIITVDELLSTISNKLKKVWCWDSDGVNPKTNKGYLIHTITIGNPLSPYIIADIDDIDKHLPYNPIKWRYIEEIKEDCIPEYTFDQLTKIVGHKFKIK